MSERHRVPKDIFELRTVAVALLASLLLWNLPFGGLLLYPFKLLATWLHEMSHALMMMLTGVGLGGVQIYRDTSGLAFTASRGAPWQTAIVSTSGYMGTALWGAVLLVVTPTPRAARRALLLLAVLMAWTAAMVVVDVGDDSFGMWAVIGMAIAMAVVAVVVPGRWRVALAHFVAAQSCVNALLDIRVLLRPSQVINGQDAAMMSDAHAMAKATFGTTQPWAVYTWSAIWLAWSLAVLFAALRFSGSRASPSAAPSGPATASLPDGSDRDAHRRSRVTARGERDPSESADTGEF